jgi:hypothetical protein
MLKNLSPNIFLCSLQSNIILQNKKNRSLSLIGKFKYIKSIIYSIENSEMEQCKNLKKSLRVNITTTHTHSLITFNSYHNWSIVYILIIQFSMLKRILMLFYCLICRLLHQTNQQLSTIRNKLFLYYHQLMFYLSNNKKMVSTKQMLLLVFVIHIKIILFAVDHWKTIVDDQNISFKVLSSKDNDKLKSIDDKIDDDSKKLNSDKKSDESTTIVVHRHVAVGGTFDHLHAGHKLLLSVCVAVARETLTIGITGKQCTILCCSLARLTICLQIPRLSNTRNLLNTWNRKKQTNVYIDIANHLFLQTAMMLVLQQCKRLFTH